MGPCLSSGNYVLPTDSLDSENYNGPPSLSERDKKPLLTNKEEVPSPPRTRAPESLRKGNRSSTLFKGGRVDINALEDIPEAPEFDEDEFKFTI